MEILHVLVKIYTVADLYSKTRKNKHFLIQLFYSPLVRRASVSSDPSQCISIKVSSSVLKDYSTELLSTNIKWN